MPTRLLGEVVAVDGVTPVRRQRLVPAGLGVLRPRLGVLTGDAADLDDRNLRGIGHHYGHGQLDEQLALDVGSRDGGEGLGAVAALQQERLPVGDVSHLVAEVVTLARKDQGRK